MKRILFVLLMMTCSVSWGGWVMHAETDTTTHYYDPATLKKDGHIRKVWVLQDLKKRHKDGEMSRRARGEYDCKQERVRYLTMTEHSEPMAGGEVLLNAGEDRVWREIPPNTPSADIFNLVCSH
jgi:hypothetical protein